MTGDNGPEEDRDRQPVVVVTARLPRTGQWILLLQNSELFHGSLDLDMNICDLLDDN